MTNMGFVYLTTCSNTSSPDFGKSYVGAAAGDPDTRHTYLGSGIDIEEAVNRLGKESFTRSLLYVGSDFEVAELEWIDRLNAVDDPTFYNRNRVSSRGSRGIGRNDEFRQDVSERNRGNKHRLGMKHSVESKRRISEAKKGQRVGLPTWNKGKSAPQIGDALRGRVSDTVAAFDLELCRPVRMTKDEWAARPDHIVGIGHSLAKVARAKMQSDET